MHISIMHTSIARLYSAFVLLAVPTILQAQVRGQESNPKHKTGELKVEVDEKARVTRLIPIGEFPTPTPGLKWTVDKNSFQGEFRGQAPDGSRLIVTRMKPATSQTLRKEIYQNQQERVATELRKAASMKARVKQRGVSGKLQDREIFWISMEGEKKHRHAAVVIHFRRKHTYVLCGSAAEKDRATVLVAALEQLKPEGDLKIPDEAVAEVKAHVTELQALLKDGKHRQLLGLVMPPEIKEEFKKAPEQFEQIVAQFGKRNAKELENALAKLDWKTAEYEPAVTLKGDDARITFSNGDRPVMFQKVDGKWTIQN